MHANDPATSIPNGFSRRGLLAAVPLSAALLAVGVQPAVAAPGRSGPRSVVRVEVNNNPPPVFDVAVIFAANIN